MPRLMGFAAAIATLVIAGHAVASGTNGPAHAIAMHGAGLTASPFSQSLYVAFRRTKAASLTLSAPVRAYP